MSLTVPDCEWLIHIIYQPDFEEGSKDWFFQESLTNKLREIRKEAAKRFRITEGYQAMRQEKVLDPCQICNYSHYEFDLRSCKMQL